MISSEYRKQYFNFDDELHDVLLHGTIRRLRVYSHKNSGKYYSTYLTVFENERNLFEVELNSDNLTWIPKS